MQIREALMQFLKNTKEKYKYIHTLKKQRKRNTKTKKKKTFLSKHQNIQNQFKINGSMIIGIHKYIHTTKF